MCIPLLLGVASEWGHILTWGGEMSLWEMSVTQPSEGLLGSHLCFYYPNQSALGWWVGSPEPGFHSIIFLTCLSWDLVKGSKPWIGDQLCEETQWAGTRNGK